MEAKLRILMQNENLTASKLADILEVKPAAISHILSGRNKPSFELICKIVTRFPHINPYWLLGDASEMFNTNAQNSTSEISKEIPGTLFDLAEKRETVFDHIKPATPTTSPMTSSGFSSSEIEKIVIVYRDKTFEELKPKNS